MPRALSAAIQQRLGSTGLKQRFASDGGLHVSEATHSSLDFSLVPEGVQWTGGQLVPARSATAGHDAGRTTFDLGPLQSWYRTSDAGIEQGFTIPRSLHSGTDVSVVLGSSGSLRVEQTSATALSLTTPAGVHVLSYDALSVRDASGARLPARFETSGRVVRIVIDATHARYPLTVDPIVQQARLTLAATAESDTIGYSVAASSDGSVVAVGVPGQQIGFNPSQGMVIVFSGTNWRTQTELADGDGGPLDQLGYSVAISSDGSTIVAGAPDHEVGGESGYEQGEAVVFSGTDWGTQATLTASNGGEFDELGYSVGISSDGSTIVAGAPYHYVGEDGLAEGEAVVFDGTDWATQTDLIAGAVGERLGWSVAISGDGSTIVAGAPYATVNSHLAQGAAFVFSGTDWGTQTLLAAANGAVEDLFGYSVAISPDASTIVAGVPDHEVGANADQGEVIAFTGSSWVTQTDLTATGGASDDILGTSVATSSDGSTIVAGASGADSGQGEVVAFTGSGWDTQTPLTVAGGDADGGLGSAIAISSDGSTIVAGAPFATVGGAASQGEAVIFQSTSTTATVTVTGSQTYGSSTPSYTYTSTPSGVTVSSISCATVGSSTSLDSTLAVGTYTILGSSCTGTAEGYDLTFQGASNGFTVNAEPVTVNVSGSQASGSSTPTFTYTTSPSGITIPDLSCTTVGTATTIDSSLAVGTYTVLGSSCTSTASSNYALTYQGVSDGFVVTAVAGATLYAAAPPGDTGDCTASSSPCSLSEAIGEASATDTIELAAGTYTGNWTISAAITLQGADQATTILDDGNSETVIGSDPGSGVVTINDLTIEGGKGSYGLLGGDGGGVYVASGSLAVTDCAFSDDTATFDGGAIDSGDDSAGGTVTVTGCAFTDDTAIDGGAIDNGDNHGSGTLTVTDSTFSDDDQSGTGGAIDNGDNHGLATATVTDSTFSGDSAGNGGAIANGDDGGSGTLTVTDSTFTSDKASDPDGGAIANGNIGGSGTLTVTGSTFTGDSAIEGGAIDNGSYDAGNGTATVTASTFSDDTVSAGDGFSADGGAIDNGDLTGSGTLAVTSSTFDDDASGGHAAIDNGDNGGDGTVGLRADILAGASDGGVECHGIPESDDDGFNVSDDSSCNFATLSTSGSTSIGSYLGTLGDYGGDTDTIPLLATESLPAASDPAYDFVSSGVDDLDATSSGIETTGTTVCDTDDQRGDSRPPSGDCDAGAWDSWSALALSPSPPTAVVGQTVTYTATLSTGEASPGGSVSFSSDAAGDDSLDCGSGSESFDPATGVATCVVAYSSPTSATAYAFWSGDDQEPAAGSTEAQVTVGKAATTPVLTVQTPDPVTGEPVEIGAAVFSVSPGSGTPTGSLLVSDGTNSCTAELTAGQGDCTLTEAAAGSYDLTASYQGDSNYDPSSDESSPTQLLVAADQTDTTVTVQTQNPLPDEPIELQASVAAASPGSGTPTGSVLISDGTNTCTANLSDGTGDCTLTETAVGDYDLTASYQGDSNYDTSNGGSSLTVGIPAPPTISYTLSSSQPESPTGWYRAPVTVTFTCAPPSGATLTGACPAPVTLTTNGAGQTATATIKTTNGAQASVTASGIDIDQSTPTVKITGPKRSASYLLKAPTAHCQATDTISGISTCSLTTKKTKTSLGYREKLTAHATTLAGVTSTTSLSFTVQTSTPPAVPGFKPVKPTKTAGSVYILPLGHSYKLIVTSKTRPRYVFAAPAPRPPAGGNVPFHRDGKQRGTPRWEFTVTLPTALVDFPDWNLGIQIGKRLDVLTIQTHS